MSAPRPDGLHSMTGFGRASLERDSVRVELEIRSVNNRHLTCKCRLPTALQRFERDLGDRIRKKVSRGSFDLSIRARAAGSPVRPMVDTRLAAAYAKAIDAFLGEQSWQARVSPEFILSLPGVVSTEEETEEVGSMRARVIEALDLALAELLTMRASEGARLYSELLKRSRKIERLVDRIEKRSPRVVKDYQQRLRERLNQLLGDGPLAPDDESLRREVAYLAERADVTEEIDRLRSHIVHLTELLDARGAVGRRLEFVVQEMGRETNTIGSKANDAGISRLVVEIKAELEKLREQVQNIE